MAQTKNATYKYDNGVDYDELHFKTNYEQVINPVNSNTLTVDMGKKVSKINNIYFPTTTGTSLDMTLNIGVGSCVILDVVVQCGGGDPNHSITGTWLIKTIKGDVYTLKTSDLLGTVSKVGNAQTLTVVNNGDGTIKVTVTQTGTLRAKFIYQITEINYTL